MGNPPMSREDAEYLISVIQAAHDEGFKLRGEPSAYSEASRRLKLHPSTLNSRSKTAGRLHGVYVVQRDEIREDAPAAEVHDETGLDETIRASLIISAKTVPWLIHRTRTDLGSILDAIERLKQSGVNIHRFGERFEIPKHTEPGWVKGVQIEYLSEADNTFKFGVVGDNHCASKYERRDVLSDLYDRFEAAGITKVFHTGNWCDGDASFNRHDLLAHGIEPQCQLLADTYPRRTGITTYAISGDDHEGWWAKREGIDVGTYAEGVMRRSGREDWVHLGYMEAHVRLVNANSGKENRLAVVHPGGGSAYALSYAVQKIIESLEGGEKPGVGLYGHYHKIWAGNIRNVWCLVSGCCQDQTPFMRGRKIEAQVAGTLVTLEQDPETAAIIGFCPDMKRYFTKGYYEKRWSHSGPVNQTARTVGGI